MTRFNTLLLDQTKWDLVLDAAGNIAVASAPYSLAQDVASACRLFLGELWYARDKGIPYFGEILGHTPPVALITGHMEAAALTVPGVVSAQCVITNSAGRSVTGTLIFTDETGKQNVVGF